MKSPRPHPEIDMEGLRFSPRQGKPAIQPCKRCAAADRSWDRIAGEAYCPECEEALILGEAEAVSLRTLEHPCLLCKKTGTVAFLTFPLRTTTPLEMDLCPRHLRALLSRSLKPAAFRRMQRLLGKLRVEVDSVFLLHEEFYNAIGEALQPAIEME